MYDIFFLPLFRFYSKGKIEKKKCRRGRENLNFKQINMYQTIDQNIYTEQLKNLPLFLRGVRLERPEYDLYLYLFKTAYRRNCGLTLKTTVQIVASSIGRDISRTKSLLHDVKVRGLFDKFELQTDKLFIKIKDLSSYARFQH